MRNVKEISNHICITCAQKVTDSRHSLSRAAEIEN